MTGFASPLQSLFAFVTEVSTLCLLSRTAEHHHIGVLLFRFHLLERLRQFCGDQGHNPARHTADLQGRC